MRAWLRLMLIPLLILVLIAGRFTLSGITRGRGNLGGTVLVTPAEGLRVLQTGLSLLAGLVEHLVGLA